MRLSECLTHADISVLQKVADYYQLSCIRHSKLSLLQEILITLRNPDLTVSQVNKWSVLRRQAMMRLSFDSRGIFSTEELEAMFQSQGDSMALSELTRQGWLYPTTRFNGRLQYCLPEELQKSLATSLTSEMLTHLRLRREEPLICRDEGYALVRDFEVLLEYAKRHRVQLTVEGSLYKRNLEQLLQLLEVAEFPPESGWRFGYGRRFHDYPDRLALMYDFAYQQQLLVENEESILAVTDEIPRWQQLAEIVKLKRLFNFYVSLYRRAIFRLPLILRLLMQLPKDHWVNSLDLLSILGDLVQPYYYDARDNVWENRILKMLMHLGVLRTGIDEDRQTWFQITQVGQQLLSGDTLPQDIEVTTTERRVLMVQPNFEIVATADHTAILTELALLCDLKEGGTLRIYRMSEASARHGLASGKTADEWIDFLSRYSQTPVPGNVERTLREWERLYRVQEKADSEGLSG